jgi:hypothetical membrane protein
MDVPPLPDGCPWSGWALPNVNWCEENLCAWVVNPANTWSNVAFIVMGIIMIVVARRHRDVVLEIFGPTSIVLALVSGIYHASYTFFFQVFDFTGMFLYISLPLMLNMRRLGKVGTRGVLIWFVVISTVLTLLLIPLAQTGFPIQATIFVLILVVVIQEGILWKRGADQPDRRWFFAALGLLAIAATFSTLDVTRTWCEPSNHIVQGHALWHLFSALGLLAAFFFYRQFDAPGGAETASDSGG